jgi:predicted dehydrogenase
MSQETVSRKIRVGVIGASPSWGWGTVAHLPALAMLPAYEVTAVSTTRRETAEETARRFGVRHAFDQSERLIEHADVDLVVVSVRAPEHARLVRAAIAAKKDVFCEWPLGVSLEETLELTKLASSAGVRTAIGLQRRLAPGVRYLHDLLAEGYIGKVRSATIHVAIPILGARREKAYAYTADANGGANTLATVTAHFLDCVLAAVGEVESLSAVVARQFDETTLLETGEVVPVTAPDQVILAGTFRSGAVLSAHFENGKRNGPVIACTITGTEGDIVLGHDLTLTAARGDAQPLEPLPTPERYFWCPKGSLGDDAHQVAHLYTAFAKDLANGTSVAPTFADASKLHHLLGAIAESSKTGQRQSRWPQSLEASSV